VTQRKRPPKAGPAADFGNEITDFWPIHPTRLVSKKTISTQTILRRSSFPFKNVSPFSEIRPACPSLEDFSLSSPTSPKAQGGGRFFVSNVFFAVSRPLWFFQRKTLHVPARDPFPRSLFSLVGGNSPVCRMVLLGFAASITNIPPDQHRGLQRRRAPREPPAADRPSEKFRHLPHSAATCRNDRDLMTNIPARCSAIKIPFDYSDRLGSHQRRAFCPRPHPMARLFPCRTRINVHHRSIVPADESLAAVLERSQRQNAVDMRPKIALNPARASPQFSSLARAPGTAVLAPPMSPPSLPPFSIVRPKKNAAL